MSNRPAPRRRLHLAIPLLALTLSGCGDIAAWFGPSPPAVPSSASARCTTAVQGMPRPQATAIHGHEVTPADDPANAFAHCMRAAGWQTAHGFAVPAATVMQVTAAPRGTARRTFGAEVNSVAVPFQTQGYARGSTGLVITDILPGGAAQAAGLRRGDILLGFAGTPVGGPETLQATLTKLTPGARIAVEFWRDQSPTVATLAF